MSSTHKIKRQSIPETLAESLRERILNGEFKGGEPLVQETIAAEYGVSRMPVREAFRQLEAAGLVVFQIHKGAIVTSIPEEQISELFDLRALLECELLARSIPSITEAQLAVAREILPRLEDAYHRRDVSSWGTLNWEFHKSLYAGADRIQTLTVVQGINLQTERYVRLQLLLTDAVEDAEVDHREILRLCEARDVERAVVYLRKHILDAGRQLRDALKQNGMTSA